MGKGQRVRERKEIPILLTWLGAKSTSTFLKANPFGKD